MFQPGEEGHHGARIMLEEGLLGDPLPDAAFALHIRSEEHTSELQSLMRISYAVFCLKKKTQKKTTCRHYLQKYNSLKQHNHISTHTIPTLHCLHKKSPQ